MDPISVIGIILSLLIAYWQYRKAHKAEAELNSVLKSLPKDTLNELGAVITASANASSNVREPSDQPLRGAFITYADVNGDSQDEMLIQHPSGNHGIALKVLGFRDYEFQLLAELGCGTPEGFTFGDFDGDGRIEIAARETDWAPAFKYASAPRMTIIFKWDGNSFARMGEVKDRLNVSLKNITNQNGG